MARQNGRLVGTAVVAFVVALLCVVAPGDTQPPGQQARPLDMAHRPARPTPAREGNPGSTTGQRLERAARAPDPVTVESPSTFYSHPSVPYGTAGFNLFFSLTHMNAMPGTSEAAVRKIQEATGVDSGTAVRLMTYVDAAVEDYSRRFKELQSESCAMRSQLTTIPKIAQEFDRTKVAAELRRVQLVRGAESILGSEGMQRLDLYLSRANGRSQLVESDYESALWASGRTPEEILADYCRKVEATNP
jgi:hypothetical protein